MLQGGGPSVTLFNVEHRTSNKMYEQDIGQASLQQRVKETYLSRQVRDNFLEIVQLFHHLNKIPLTPSIATWDRCEYISSLYFFGGALTQ